MLICRVFVVTPFAQNCRLLYDSESLEAVIVDPGGEATRLLTYINDNGLTLNSIWLTHSHIDHCGGVSQFYREFDSKISGDKPPLFGNKLESEMRGRIGDQAKMLGIPGGMFENCPEPDEWLEQGTLVELGKYSFKSLFTPGHSPGHIAFYFENPKPGVSGNEGNKWQIDWDRGEMPSESGNSPLLIAGDTLFQSSIGRTDLPGGNHAQLIDSIKNEILSLPEDTKVMPGHGPDTTVYAEKSSNPFLK